MKIFQSALLVWLLVGCSQHPHGTVSLAIVDASAKREPEYLDIACTAAIDNRTGSSLTVTSSFFSAFDGLSMVVMSNDGQQLAAQSYVMHQSPSSAEGHPFVLPPGRTTHEMRIPVFALTNAPAEVGLQLVGHLPRSAFTAGVTSGIVRVTVK